MIRVHYLPVLLLALATGCGPTPQQRYDTALSILQKEQDRLEKLKPAFDEAVQRASDAVVEKSTGSTLNQALEGEDPSNQEINVNLSTASLDDALQAADDMLQQSAAKRETLSQIDDTVQRISQPGTKENTAFRLQLAKNPEYRAYRRQLKRVARAEREVTEAESALPSRSAP